jgi:predicted kinase
VADSTPFETVKKVGGGDEEARPFLLIITGDPATGKSTLAKHCSGQLGVPICSRDMIKELMFDSLGWSDREWSKRIGSASFELMFYFLNVFLDAGSSVILDCNLSSENARKTLREILSGRSHDVAEVICNPKPEIAFKRFRDRARNGIRHPGHGDDSNLEEFRATIGNHPQDPMIPGSKLIIVDTGISSEADVSRQVLDILRDID